jgi:hypothetical protein
MLVPYSGRINSAVPAAKDAASGKVMIQLRTILPTSPRSSFPVTKPVPLIEPTETCVVETGNPNELADNTRPLVTRFATSPCSWARGTIFLLIVSATLRPLSKPPMAIATAMIQKQTSTPVTFAANNRAASFGVSFTARAKQMVQALRKCSP